MCHALPSVIGLLGCSSAPHPIFCLGMHLSAPPYPSRALLPPPLLPLGLFTCCSLGTELPPPSTCMSHTEPSHSHVLCKASYAQPHRAGFSCFASCPSQTYLDYRASPAALQWHLSSVSSPLPDETHSSTHSLKHVSSGQSRSHNQLWSLLCLLPPFQQLSKCRPWQQTQPTREPKRNAHSWVPPQAWKRQGLCSAVCALTSYPVWEPRLPSDAGALYSMNTE